MRILLFSMVVIGAVLTSGAVLFAMTLSPPYSILLWISAAVLAIATIVNSWNFGRSL